MARVGNTVRLRGSFVTFDGIAADPIDIVVKIYDSAKTLLQTIPLDVTNRVDVGTYECFYTIPDGNTQLYVEFSGVLESYPILGRMVLTREW